MHCRVPQPAERLELLDEKPRLGRFAAVLASAADDLTKGANAALKVLPGQPQLSGAVRGPMLTMSGGAASGPVGGGYGGAGVSPQGPTLGGGGASVGGGAVLGVGGGGGITVGAAGAPGSTGDPVADMQAAQMQMINLQVGIQTQAEIFSSTSNALNAEHQAKMNVIQNIRA